MYGRMGYRDCCTVSEFSCDAGEAVALRPVSRMRNSPRLRREYLPPDGVIQEGANLSYLEMLRRILRRGGFSAGRRSTTVTA